MRGLGRDFKFLLAARAISVIGDQAAMIALIFKVKSHGSWSTAALMMGMSIAMIATAPFIGKLVDRHSVKRILIITSLFQALVCFGLMYSNLYLILFLNIFLGVGQATVLAATGAWTPTLVTQDQLGKAFGQMQVIYSLAALAGYGIGGVLVGKAGVQAALLLDAISFLLLIPMLIAIRTDRIGHGETNEKKRMKGGYGIVWSNPALRNIAITLTAFITALTMFNPVEVYLTTDILGAGATGYGVINMVWAGSLAFGSLVIAKYIKPTWGYAKPALIVCALAGTSLIGVGLSPNLIFLGFMLFIAGIVVAGFNIFIGPLIVNNSVESELGRVNATVGALNSFGSAIGMAMGGYLGHVLPVRLVIVLAGSLSVFTLIFTGKGLLAAEKK